MSHAAHHYQRVAFDRKRELFGDLRGTVVGTGANFTFVPAGVRWIAIEPNRYMHSSLRRAALASGVDFEVRQARIEDIDIPDRTADAVVSTLVLCSVGNQQKAMQEVRRILKHGGAFIFLEHVAADRGMMLRCVQHCVQPVLRCLADGCRPVRDTAEAIQSAGFSEVSIERFRLPLGPLGPHIAGLAIR